MAFVMHPASFVGWWLFMFSSALALGLVSCTSASIPIQAGPLAGGGLGAGAPTPYAGPTTIATAGTYSGSWTSASTSTAAVTITTTGAVTLENCNLTGAGNLIEVVAGANVTLRNCIGIGTVPTIPGRPHGFVMRGIGDGPLIVAQATIENNDFQHLSGFEFTVAKNPANGNHSIGPTTATIAVRYNTVEDIDGRVLGSTCTIDGAFDAYCHVHFVGLLGLRDDPNIVVAWNEVINAPNESAMEDEILVDSSSGLPNAEISIHDNYIQGAYGLTPTAPSPAPHWGGSGINAGDDSAAAGGGDSTGRWASQYVQALDNVIVGATNWGLCLVAANNVTIAGNRIVHSGFVSGGIATNNNAAGLVLANIYGIAAGAYSAIAVQNNTVGYTWLVPQPAATPQTRRFDYKFFDVECKSAVVAVDACCPPGGACPLPPVAGFTNAGNVDFAFSPAPNAVQYAAETAELPAFAARAAAQGIVIGVSPALRSTSTARRR